MILLVSTSSWDCRCWSSTRTAASNGQTASCIGIRSCMISMRLNQEPPETTNPPQNTNTLKINPKDNKKKFFFVLPAVIRRRRRRRRRRITFCCLNECYYCCSCCSLRSSVLPSFPHSLPPSVLMGHELKN